MQEKLKQICAVSGIEGELGFGENDLEEDWDPVKYEVKGRISSILIEYFAVFLCYRCRCFIF